MLASDAQLQMRTVYVGGLAGQLVSAGIWLASALATSLLTPRHGILVLVIGGMFIVPLLLPLAGVATLYRQAPRTLHGWPDAT